jgi:hypothetical protein
MIMQFEDINCHKQTGLSYYKNNKTLLLREVGFYLKFDGKIPSLADLFARV